MKQNCIQWCDETKAAVTKFVAGFFSPAYREGTISFPAGIETDPSYDGPHLTAWLTQGNGSVMRIDVNTRKRIVWSLDGCLPGEAISNY